MNNLYEENKELLEKLQNKIKYHFNDKNLLLESLTHKSYDKINNNERLEFLGDAVLDLLIGEYLYKKLPKSNEGDLTKFRASMVNEASFATLARAINLGDYLFISNGEIKNKGKEKPSILSDALEALFGAIYLDSDINNAKKIIYALIQKVYKNANPQILFKDYKTLLQELTQRIFGLIPEYTLINSSGPDHSKIFTMKIIINNVEYAIKKGKSKKEAEQACAKTAYEKIKKRYKQKGTK